MKNFLYTAFALSCLHLSSFAFSEENFALIGSYSLPTRTIYKDRPMGGLSGIVYDTKNNLYYAISDTRNTKKEGPSRFYSLSIDLDKKGIHNVEIKNMSDLLDQEGKEIKQGEVDAEGIALLPNGEGIYWSSELGSGLRTANFSGGLIDAYSSLNDHPFQSLVVTNLL